jgi:hypothetical protein
VVVVGVRASAASIRDDDGRSLRNPTSSRPGLEKKPSVITADVPSSTSSVDTPIQVTVSGDCGVPSGRSKCLRYFEMSGRPYLSRIS